MRSLVLQILLIIALCFSSFPQDKPDFQFKNGRKISDLNAPDSDGFRAGILYSFDVTNTRIPLGITVVNDTIIISSAGQSSQDFSDNYLYKFLFDGTVIDSVKQNSNDGWGFRDLAYDGTFILGSENEYVKKINPLTFEVVDSVFNNTNNPHRGLAYDPEENAIWSANYIHGPLVKFNADNGTTIKDFGIPAVSPYGIAIDKFNNEDEMYLWYTEPSIDGPVRITKIDTSTGINDLSFDLSEELTDHYSGGIEIINGHPSFPGKIIAILIAQGNPAKVLFADISLNGIPEAPSNINAVKNSEEIVLSWNDPVSDLNNNPVLIDSIQIYRNNLYLGSVKNGVETYEDNISIKGSYRYKLIAFNDSIKGISSLSNKILIDMILFEDFEDAVLPEDWLVLNSNDDEQFWRIINSFTYNNTPGGSNSISISWNSDQAMDDWFFTPAIAMDSLNYYNLQFYYCSSPSENYTENLTVFLSDTNNGINIIDTLYQHLKFKGEDFFFADTVFSPPENDNYYVGFYGHSDSDQLRIAVDDISLSEIIKVPVEMINPVNTVPSVFRLEQNFPNPFNPVTTISFTLAVESKVTLTIYNVVGEEIVQLLKENMPAGLKSQIFDASSLNSGVYFYNIKAVGIDGTIYNNTRKMILIK